MSDLPEAAYPLARLQGAVGDQLIRLTWDQDAFDEARRGGLRQLLRVAVERSPWHRARLGGIDPEQADIGMLRSLPVMTKDDLMGGFDNIITVPGVSLADLDAHVAGAGTDVELFRGKLLVLASGGSSGRRGVFPFTINEAATYMASAARSAMDWRRRTGRPAPAVQARVTAASTTHATRGLSGLFADPARPVHHFPITSPMSEIVTGLNDLQPDSLWAYPSALSELAAEQLAGRLHVTPGELITSSEPLTLETRQLAAQAWGMAPANAFGATEGLMGWADADSDILTFSDDLVIVEPVDEHRQPVGLGQTASRLLVTNLYNHTLPLIRYELTDEVIVEPYGDSPFLKVRTIGGRSDDVFRYGDLVVHPLTFRSPLGKHPAIIEYQVRQTVGGADISVIASADLPLETVATTVRDSLAEVGLPDAAVNVDAVPELSRHTLTGKLRRFIPLPSS